MVKILGGILGTSYLKILTLIYTTLPLFDLLSQFLVNRGQISIKENAAEPTGKYQIICYIT